MSEAAIRLGPLDLAALLPQLGRLDREVVASQTESGATFPSLAAGLALPTGHATIALGIRSTLRYRGLVLARQLAGGPTWEVTCLRLADDDGPLVTALLAGACRQLLDRRAQTVLVRYLDSRHDLAFRTAGFVPFAVEHLYAVVGAGGTPENALVEVGRKERGDIFRLYCRTVPEAVRRHEAPTIDGFNAFHDAAAIEHDGIQLSQDGTPVLWVGLGAQESRVLSYDSTLIDVALDHLESVAPERRLVVPEFDTVLQAAATQRGYRHVGTRTVAARHLARMLPLGETVAVPAAGTVSIPHG